MTDKQYTEQKEYEKKEFAPEFNLILFEEPEAFLHPGKQGTLNSYKIELEFN